MYVSDTPYNVYSLCQKKRTFNSEFFHGPPGGGGPKIHMVDYVNVNFWPPSPRGATKKIGIKCAFLLTQTVVNSDLSSFSLESSQPLLRRSIAVSG